MSTFNAFEMSPVPTPSKDAQPPEPFHGIYGMPMFVTVPTSDLDASVDFWTEALGFFPCSAFPAGSCICAAGPSRTSFWCRPRRSPPRPLAPR